MHPLRAFTITGRMPPTAVVKTKLTEMGLEVQGEKIYTDPRPTSASASASES